MKRRWSRTELFLIGTPLLIALAALIASGEPLLWRFPFLSPRANARSSSCQNNLKQLAIGLVQYSQDYDSKFPPAKIGGARPAVATAVWSLNPPVGWVDAIYPYTKSFTIQFCPSVGGAGLYGMDPTLPNPTHRYFNGNLSAFSTKGIARPASTLLCGDGNDGTDVADGTYSKTSLPPTWLSDYSSPCYRHLGGANYLFVDGHVKWLEPRQISTAPGARYTFAIR